MLLKKMHFIFILFSIFSSVNCCAYSAQELLETRNVVRDRIAVTNTMGENFNIKFFQSVAGSELDFVTLVTESGFIKARPSTRTILGTGDIFYFKDDKKMLTNDNSVMWGYLDSIKNTIDYPATDEKFKIIVFTRLDDEKCKAFHKNIKQLNDLGISVSYVFDFADIPETSSTYQKMILVGNLHYSEDEYSQLGGDAKQFTSLMNGKKITNPKDIAYHSMFIRHSDVYKYVHPSTLPGIFYKGVALPVMTPVELADALKNIETQMASNDYQMAKELKYKSTR